MPEVDVETNGQAPTITVEQAWANIVQACGAFVGNLQQHQAIQQSLELVGKRLIPENG